MTRRIAVLAWLAAALGCQTEEALPPLFPVEGTVVNKGVPVKGGAVSFMRQDEQTPLIVIGDVDEDGNFTLATVKGRQKIPGAPQGNYRVTYSPPVIGKQALPVTPAQVYAVAPSPNKISIDLATTD